MSEEHMVLQSHEKNHRMAQKVHTLFRTRKCNKQAPQGLVHPC